MKLSKIFSLSVVFLAFLLPLFYLPLTTDFYIFNKATLLYFSVGLLLIGWLVKAYQKQGFSVLKNSFNLPVLALVLVFLVSTIIQSPNRLMSLSYPTGIFLSLGLLFCIMVNNIKEKKAVDWIITSLVASSVVLAWLTIFAYLGLTENIGPEWLKSKAWTPTGGPLNTLSLMLVLLPGTLFWAFKSKGSTEKILLFLASSLQVLSIILIVSIFMDKSIQFLYLPPQYGWQICVEGFKNLRTALLGVGPGNFISAFNQFRPVGLNNTDVWTIKFGVNSNEYFNLLSTVGVLGLAVYLWLVSLSLKKENWRGNLTKKVLYLILAASFVVQLLIASNIITWLVIFVGLALLQILKKPSLSEFVERYRFQGKPVIWASCGLVLLFALAVFYLQGRVWAADYYFRQSLLAAQANKGIDTYNLQIKALRLNPFGENYRVSYANTNFALANSLSAQENISDQDRANISQLVSQSIREAKAAVNLNPQVSVYWLNLATIYRNIINVAQGADEWAASAYLEAVRTDPTNPLLRVNYGGLFFSLGDYDGAIEQFKTAVNLKPDYANAYYNLAAVYKVQEEWQRAFLNMQLAVNLVPTDSPDLARVMSELEELRAKLPALPAEATGAGQAREEERLQVPQAFPSPQPGFGDINLPEESGPEVSPSPSPEPSPSPSEEERPASETRP